MQIYSQNEYVKRYQEILFIPLLGFQIQIGTVLIATCQPYETLHIKKYVCAA